jgi:hypothetical protein
MAIAAFALTAVVAFSYETLAQRATQAAVETWVDGLLAEVRKGGADARRGAVTYNPATGALTVADVVITPQGDRAVQLNIGRIVGTDVQAGPRFRAASLAMEGIEARLAGPAGTRIAVERVAFEGLDMASAAPDALAGRAPGGMGAVLRQMNAARLSIPAVTLRMTNDGKPTEMVLANYAVTDIRNGVAQSLTVGRQTYSVDVPASGTMTVTAEPSSGERVDLSVFADLLAPAADAKRDRRLAYALYRSGAITVDIPGTGLNVKVGEATVSNAYVTPPRVGYLAFLDAAEKMQASAGSPDPAAVRAFASMVSEWMELFTMEQLRIASVAVTTPDVNVTTGALEMRDFGGTRYGLLSLANLQVDGAVRGSMQRFALSDFEFGAFIKASFESMAQGQAMPDPRAMEGRLPRIGGIEIAGLSVESPGTPAIALESATFQMGAWRGFVPDRLALAVRRLVIPEALVPTRTPGPSDLGYETFDISSDIRIALDEAAKRAELTPGRVALADMGAVDLRVALTDVDSSQLGFDGLSDPGPLLANTRVGGVRLRIENTGLLERLSTYFGRAQNIPPETLRQTLVMSLAPMVPMLVQDQAARQQAQQALQTFAQTPRSLTFALTPKGPLSLADVMLLTSGNGPPIRLLARFDVAVTAND